MDTPEWVRDAVFYQIFPDRYAPSTRVAKAGNLEAWDSLPTDRGYKGGDLFGIVEHLDHVEALGATALYLTPVFQAASNHRYNTHDYYRVDPMLGGNPALRELLDACHARGIKVILDGVFNHSGRGFFQFNDLLENGRQSPYGDWFRIRSWPLNAYSPDRQIGYEAWWGLPTLPKFNTLTAAVREFLWGVATHWLEFGIDGWRLDVPNEIDDDDFWREFRRRCRAVNPRCYLVGEIWGDATRWLQGDQFDAVTNYEFARAVIGFAGAGSLNHKEIAKCGYDRIEPLTAESFAAVMARLNAKYPPESTAVQLNFIASHDTPRALTVMGGDETAVRLALLYQMTYTGAPCVFYGEETGMEGGHDPLNRAGMPWQTKERWNLPLLEYTKRLISLRKRAPALRRGNYRELCAREGLYAFAREVEEQRFTVALNAGQKPARLELPGSVESSSQAEVRELLHGLTSLAGDLVFDIPARSGALFEQSVRDPS
ncbi:MAG TPA: glycoside hydrolase family 13 protein [Candidatus Binatia bacterium]